MTAKNNYNHMKPLSILIALLFSMSFECRGQNLNVVKTLGKVNFADSADLVLSAKVEGGIFSYELVDVTKPETPIFAFSLVTNSLEAFKESVKAKLKSAGKTFVVPDEALSKYYFYFLNQNPFLITDSTGGKAMEMIFSDLITIYNFKHNDFTQIKKEDILELLNKLTNKVIIKEDFFKSIFTYSFYKTLKIQLRNESPVKEIDLFDEEFNVRLSEIERGVPKSLRWEELYKEIQNRYYLALINDIDKTINIEQIQTTNGLKVINDKILELTTKKVSLENELNTNFKEIADIQVGIEDSRLRLARLKDQLETELTLYEYTVNTESENQETEQNFNSKFESNFTAIANLQYENGIVPIRIQIVNIRSMTEEDLEKLFLLDYLKVQQKTSILVEFNIESNRLRNMENSISSIKDLNENLNNSIKTINADLDGNLKRKELLDAQILSKIKNVLEGLKLSNKFNFKPRNLQLEFNRGYLENIVVIGVASIFIEPILGKYKSQIELPELTLKFVNDYPIGVSAKRDIEKLGDIKLYARYQDAVHYELRIGDLITNIKEIIALDRTDYSPQDGIVEIDLLTEKKKEFTKSDTKEILQLKVFSDFVGLQEENPNGLIQFEIDKEIPLVTKRVTRPYLGPFRFLINKGGNVGFLNFIKPRFVYSKIEDNNRSLTLKSFPVSIDTSRLGTSSLEIKQFERFSIGADLNLLLYNIPYGKSTFLVNAGMYFGRTDLVTGDTLLDVNRLPRDYTNSYQPSLELLWRVTGDERYGLEFSYGVNWIISDQFNFTQRANTYNIEDFKTFQESDSQYGIQRFTILAYLNLDSSTSGRLFCRYRSNSELWNFNNNYSQLQIGYTTYLTKKSQ
jgi:hypothetical protein